MAIEVRIPTILRTYTGGEKAVDASGATLGALVDDLEANHPGIKGRLVEDSGELRRFVKVYVDDEDVRFTGGLGTELSDGAQVVILPAVAGGCSGPARHPAQGRRCGAVGPPWGDGDRRAGGANRGHDVRFPRITLDRGARTGGHEHLRLDF